MATRGTSGLGRRVRSGGICGGRGVRVRGFFTVLPNLALRRGEAEEGLEVEGAGEHGELAGGVFGPVGFGAVPVEFDAVLVGIAKVEGFADAVVGGAVEGDIGRNEALEGGGKFGLGREKDGEVIEAGGAGWGWFAASAFPGVERDVMVVAASSKEDGAAAVALADFKAEDALIEGEGASEIGDFEVNVTNADGGGERRSGHGREWEF